MAKMLTQADAQNAAKRIVEESKQEQAERQAVINEFLNTVDTIGTNPQELKEIAALLAMPEEEFHIIAPIFLKELANGYNNINTKLFIAQSINAAGLRLEDVKEEHNAICRTIDEELAGSISAAKRSFLKQVIGLTYNVASETEGVIKRNVLIPIEYCREDAKMPVYAHLTDAGMDVFATEEITINPGETKLIPLGIKVALPIGYELQVRPKSGRSLKSKLRVANTPGTIDAGYRDEIGVIVDNIDPYIKHAEMDENGRLYDVEFGSSITIGKGEKFAQLVLSEVPKAVFYEVETVAGMGEDRQGGFGSTGDK